MIVLFHELDSPVIVWMILSLFSRKPVLNRGMVITEILLKLAVHLWRNGESHVMEQSGYDRLQIMAISKYFGCRLKAMSVRVDGITEDFIVFHRRQQSQCMTGLIYFVVSSALCIESVPIRSTKIRHRFFKILPVRFHQRATPVICHLISHSGINFKI